MCGNVYKWYNHCYWVLNFSVPMVCLLCDTGNGRGLFHRQLSNKYTVITQDQGMLFYFTKTTTDNSFSAVLLIFTHGIGPVCMTLNVDRLACISYSKWFCFPQNMTIFRRSRLQSAD